MAEIHPSGENPRAELALAELEEELREIIALGRRRRGLARDLEARRELALRIACSIAARRYITVDEAEKYIDLGSAELRAVGGRPFVPTEEIREMLDRLRPLVTRIADYPWSTKEEADLTITARVHRFVEDSKPLREGPDGRAVTDRLMSLAKSLSREDNTQY